MSDLFCPARLLVVDPRPGSGDPERLGRLTTRLHSERVAALYLVGGEPAGAVAGTLGPALGLSAQVLADPDPLEGGEERACRALLGDLADRHRGETVVVVLAPDRLGLSAAIPWGDAGGGVGVPVLTIDADGWRVGTLAD